MQWVNSENRYGGVSRGLHWLMALIILCLLGVGFYMGEMALSPLKLQVYTLHKSFGMIVLGLGVIRLIWRVAKPVPAHLPSHASWEVFLAKTIHAVFYCSFLVMPLSGWAMSSAAEYSNSFFWLFEFPPLTGKNEQVFELMEAVHEVSAFILLTGIGLHIAGALKHWLIDRDETLGRMGANPVLVVLGLALLSVPVVLASGDLFEEEGGHEHHHEHGGAKTVQAGGQEQTHEMHDGVIAPDEHGAQKWVADPAASTVDFSFTQYGQTVNGSFKDWSADIRFDPQDLEHSKVQVKIDVASIETGSSDRDEQARSESWFDAAAYPAAEFKSESFEKQDANHFVVHGDLSLRGVKMPLSFPFAVTFSEKGPGVKTAEMDGTLTLDRLAFGIGQGEWKSTEAIGGAVDVHVRVSAQAEHSI